MKKLTEINIFQLNVLLSDKQKEDFDFILNKNVYCSNCGGVLAG